MHTIHVIDEFLNKRNAWMLEFLYELEAQGVACTVCTHKRGSKEQYPFQPVLHRSKHPISYWAKALKWRNPALIHAHGAHLAEEGAQLAKRLGLPLVVSVETLEAPLHADLVLTIFEQDRQTLPQEHAQLWRPGLVRVDPIEPDCDIAYMGDQVDLFLQAISLLEDPSLSIRVLHRSRTAEDLAIDLGIPGQVTFGQGKGRITAGDAEPLPINLIQAVGQGSLPILIGPNTDRSPFFHKKNALITTNASAPELAQALQFALRDSELINAIRSGAKTLAGAFDTQTSAEHLKALYEFLDQERR